MRTPSFKKQRPKGREVTRSLKALKRVFFHPCESVEDASIWSIYGLTSRPGNFSTTSDERVELGRPTDGGEQHSLPTFYMCMHWQLSQIAQNGVRAAPGAVAAYPRQPSAQTRQQLARHKKAEEFWPLRNDLMVSYLDNAISNASCSASAATSPSPAPLTVPAYPLDFSNNQLNHVLARLLQQHPLPPDDDLIEHAIEVCHTHRRCELGRLRLSDTVREVEANMGYH
ncbi:unnamed protein product [Vitrella brassicaformis CCMP3155]|uniref:Uncharacterized protein n=1 Tax=Vitrella brassicaformis (strain CCMP3155) TaxID=1169540 RepID=A0A0G4E8E5_VITBC|nr:unnamed protein product [Vitrella brassicaformis CCMP3155]|eukprot:CEL91724.1 unnamed protein product [Vitrella brassicaformis CCMP3155]